MLMLLTARVFKGAADVAAELEVKSRGLGTLFFKKKSIPRGGTGRSAAELTKSTVAYLDTVDRQRRQTSNCNLTLAAAVTSCVHSTLGPPNSQSKSRMGPAERSDCFVKCLFSRKDNEKGTDNDLVFEESVCVFLFKNR